MLVVRRTRACHETKVQRLSPNGRRMSSRPYRHRRPGRAEERSSGHDRSRFRSPPSGRPAPGPHFPRTGPDPARHRVRPPARGGPMRRSWHGGWTEAGTTSDLGTAGRFVCPFGSLTWPRDPTFAEARRVVAAKLSRRGSQPDRRHGASRVPAGPLPTCLPSPCCGSP